MRLSFLSPQDCHRSCSKTTAQISIKADSMGISTQRRAQVQARFSTNLNELSVNILTQIRPESWFLVLNFIKSEVVGLLFPVTYLKNLFPIHS